MSSPRAVQHAMPSSNLADLLERVLDKGIVIAGDIKIKLVDVELLTLQIRLLVCSVDKAKEMGIDWWRNNPAFQAPAYPGRALPHQSGVEERLTRVEATLSKMVT